MFYLSGTNHFVGQAVWAVYADLSNARDDRQHKAGPTISAI